MMAPGDWEPAVTVAGIAGAAPGRETLMAAVVLVGPGEVLVAMPRFQKSSSASNAIDVFGYFFFLSEQQAAFCGLSVFHRRFF